MKICVMYVWVPEPRFQAHTDAFVASYQQHDPGVQHELHLICKADMLPKRWPDLPVAGCVAVGRDGFDIGPFQRLAPAFAHYDRLVLLGAYSRILQDGWLQKLTAAGPLASATGSFEVRPHLRTNCISVAPELLLRMVPCRNKQECWAFEHGERSLYATAKALGVQGFVVGVDGAYGEHDWPVSRTYRGGGQDNLICADNHTDRYANATAQQKAKLERDCWGARAGIGRAPITVLTVTIPGREESLQKTLASVYTQTVPVERQLLCAHQGGGATPQVGYSQAKNDLLTAVSTSWVAVLNDDDMWLPNHVETVAGELDNADVVYSWDAGGTRPRENCNDWTTAKLIARLEQGNFLDGNCLIRLDALRDVGGFPVDWVPGPRGNGDGHYKDSPAAFEDWELWRRLARAGARFRCVPKETWRYGVTATGRLSG